VEYGFTPNPLLTPTEFTVALTLFYEDTKGEFFSTTFFNSTIDIVETPKLIDTDLIFMLLTLLAIFTAIGEPQADCRPWHVASTHHGHACVMLRTCCQHLMLVHRASSQPSCLQCVSGSKHGGADSHSHLVSPNPCTPSLSAPTGALLTPALHTPPLKPIHQITASASAHACVHFRMMATCQLLDPVRCRRLRPVQAVWRQHQQPGEEAPQGRCSCCPQAAPGRRRLGQGHPVRHPQAQEGRRSCCSSHRHQGIECVVVKQRGSSSSRGSAATRRGAGSVASCV
jgi:hypothetical protein